MSAYSDLIPVNVLTGALGSGKTTLLEALLRAPSPHRHDGARQRARRGRDRPPPDRARLGKHPAAGERLPVLHDARRPEDLARGASFAPGSRRDSALRTCRGGDHGHRRPCPHRLHPAGRAGAAAPLPPRQRRHRGRRGQRAGAARPIRGVGPAGGAGGPARGEQAGHRRPRRSGGAARAARDAQSGCAAHRRRFTGSRSGRPPDHRHPRPAVEEPRGGALDALGRRRGGRGRRPRSASHFDRRHLLHLRCGARLDRVRSVDVDAAATVTAIACCG